MRRINRARALALSAAAVVSGASVVNAQTYQQEYTTSSSTTTRDTFNGIVGNVIDMGHDIVIDQLGFIDLGAAGLTVSHQVGLWHSGGALEGSVTIPAGTSTLSGGFEWVTLSQPIVLAAGTFYTLGATVASGDGDAWYDSGATTITFNPAFIGSNGTGSRAGRYGSGTTVTSSDEPTNQSAGTGYTAPNMRGIVNVATWTGSGSDSNLSDGANFSGNTAPITTNYTQSLTFGAASNTTVNIDANGDTFRGILFNSAAPAYTITGNGFTNIGGIENDSTNIQTISTSTPITLTEDQTLAADNGDIVINSDVVLQSASFATTIGTYGSHNVTINGAMSGGAAFNDNPNVATANLTLTNNNNSFTGTFTITSGNVLISASNALGAAGSASSGGTIMTATATLEFTGNNMNVGEYIAVAPHPNTNAQLLNVSGNNTFSGTLSLTGSGGANQNVIESDGGTLTLSGVIQSNSTASDGRNLILQGAGNGVISQYINEVSGEIRLVKNGTGTWSITGDGSYYTGGTAVNDGALVLDYTNDNGDKINGSFGGNTFGGNIALGGGTLHLLGNAGGTQQYATATVVGALAPIITQANSASNLVIVAQTTPMPGSVVQMDAGAGQSGPMLYLGPISRTPLGTVDFRGTGIANTTTANTNGILGGWATINNGADWAAADGSGNIVATTAYTSDAWGADNNTDVTISSAPASGSTTNSVRFNTGGNTLTLSGSNIIQSSGILMTPSAGASGDTITGGTIQLVNSTSTPDLIIQQFNTAGTLNIVSTIAGAANPASRTATVVDYNSSKSETNEITVSSTADLYIGMPVSGSGIPSGTVISSVINGTTLLLSTPTTLTTTTVSFTSENALTKAGPGDLELSGSSTYTGPTVIGQGRIVLNNTNALPSSIVDVGEYGTLTQASSSLIGGLTGPAVVGQGTVDLGASGLALTVAGAQSDSYYGNMVGSGGLTIAKTAFSQLNVYGNASYTGPNVINTNGRLDVRNASYVTSPSSTTVASGGEVYLLVPMSINEPFTIAGFGFTNGQDNGALHVGGSSAVTSGGTVTLSAPANIKLDGSVTFIQNGNVNSNNYDFTLMSDSTIAGVVNGNIALGTGNLNINEGPWTLTGANSYGGNTTIEGNATANITSLGTYGGGTSNLGTPAAATAGINFGTFSTVGAVAAVNGGTLDYTGAGETTSRGISLSGSGGTITNAGSGAIIFNGADNLNDSILTLNGAGSGTLAGPISSTTGVGSLSITNAGTTTYTSNPTVAITGGGGTGATATATETSGKITALTITNYGTGYTSTPTVTLSGGGGAGGAGSANLQTGGITMSGSGTWTIAGAATIGGIKINSGTIAFNSSSNSTVQSITGAGTLTKSGSGTVTVNTLTPATLSVHGGILALAQSSGTSTLAVVSSLTIDSGGQLDLTNNDLSVVYGNGADQTSNVVAKLTSGYSSGTWSGPGIVTSVAATLGHGATTLGYVDDTTNKRVLVKYTWYGDINLNGTVDYTDLLAMSPTGTTNATWSMGDFNYDTVVNADDYSLFMLGDASQNGSIKPAVPEPAMMSMLILAAGCIANRRRRHG